VYVVTMLRIKNQSLSLLDFTCPSNDEVVNSVPQQEFDMWLANLLKLLVVNQGNDDMQTGHSASIPVPSVDYNKFMLFQKIMPTKTQ